MQSPHFSRRITLFFVWFCCLLLVSFSNVWAEGYQLSQNLQSNQTLLNYQVSNDGKYAVYQIDSFDENFNQSSQLFAVDLATSARRALTPVIGGDGKFLGSYRITPNSQNVVYNASLEADAFFRSELYSIPIAATSQNQRKNIGNLPANSPADIFNFFVSPDSLHVVYQTREENAAFEDFEILFRVAPTGGAVTQLTPRAANGRASNAVFTPDSTRIVYQYAPPAGDTIYQSVSLSGQGRKTLTDRATNAAEKITSDSKRFVFLAEYISGENSEIRLYSITLAGNETRKQLSKNGEEVSTFQFANNLPAVVYAFRLTSVAGFYPTAFGFVPADKSYESVSYNTGKEIDFFNYAVSPNNSSVIYVAGGFGATQLYSLTFQNNAPLEQQLSIPAPGQAAFNGVTDFKIAPNSQRVVFRATQGDAFTPDLFSVAIANNPAAVKLNRLPGENSEFAADYGVSNYYITPNSQRVIFTYPPTDGSCCGNNAYTNAITGGTPTGPFATAVNDDSTGGILTLTADARRLVYTKTIFDEFGNSTTTLWAANVPQ